MEKKKARTKSQRHEDEEEEKKNIRRFRRFRRFAMKKERIDPDTDPDTDPDNDTDTDPERKTNEDAVWRYKNFVKMYEL